MTKPIFTPFAEKPLKNIIFDLGGVILNIDYHLTINAFKSLGIENFEEIFTQAKQVGIFDQLDKGIISPAQFREGIREISPVALTDSQIDWAWNALLLDFPPQRLDILRNVRKYYKTFLLSNTNAIHIEEYNKTLHRTCGVDNLSVFFDKVYYSHIINMRKPDAEAFEIILHENKLNPAETLFIDDSIQHIEGAKKLGIIAYHLNLQKGECIEKLFL
jgi:putative hydrolase of the HAD superfamily